jgi:hypothetical protein
MNLFSKFKNQSSSHPCLVCNKKIGKDYSEVRYKYQGGTGTAYVCKKCSEEMNKPNVNKDVDYGESI